MENFKLALRHLSKKDKILRKLIKQSSLKPLKPKTNTFMSLVDSIIYQQLSIKAAFAIKQRFLKLFALRKPTPEKVLSMPEMRMRTCGLSRQKVSYIKNIAKAFAKKEVAYKNFKNMSDEEVIESLIKIKGVGRWTAEMFLIFSLNRTDVYSLGDLGLNNALKKLYKINTRIHIKKLSALLKTWTPYKSLAARLLWESLKIK